MPKNTTRFGTLYAAMRSRRKPLHVGGGLRCAVAQLDAQHRDLAEPLVGHADHPGELHRRVGAQRDLDLGGRDQRAAGLDHLVAATAPVHAAVGVDVADVAGVEPAVGVEALLAGLAEVVLHQGRALDEQLAVFARRHGLAGLGVDDPQPVAGQQRAEARPHRLARSSTTGMREMKAQVSDMPQPTGICQFGSPVDATGAWRTPTCRRRSAGSTGRSSPSPGAPRACAPDAGACRAR